MLTIYMVFGWDGRPKMERARPLAFTNKRKAQQAARKARGCVITMHGDMPPKPTLLEVMRKRRPKTAAQIEALFTGVNPLFEALQWKPADEGGTC